jgi:hypothetical protein
LTGLKRSTGAKPEKIRKENPEGGHGTKPERKLTGGKNV